MIIRNSAGAAPGQAYCGGMTRRGFVKGTAAAVGLGALGGTAALADEMEVVSFLRGRSDFETAAVLGFTEGKVKACLHRGRATLRREIGRMLGREP